MRLTNHIAYRFLTDDTFVMDYIIDRHKITDKTDFNGIHPQSKGFDVTIQDAVNADYDLLSRKNNKTFLVTDTVMSKLEMLKVKKQSTNEFDWSVFFHVSNQKVTFILPHNNCLRIKFYDETIYFTFLDFRFHEGSKERGMTNWIQFFVKKPTGELAEHFQHTDVRSREEFIYKLLCFIYLSENEEIILTTGKSYGTKKTGKTINELPFPLTVINSKWNITSIRTEKFGVRGHFAIYWTGEGRSVPKMLFREPFEKKGYTRKAKKLTT